MFMNGLSPDGTGATTKAGLGVGTTTTITTANTQLYGIKAKSYTKAGTSNEASPTLDSNTGVAFLPIPTNFGSVFTICRDAAGALKAVQGQIVATDVSSKFILAPQFSQPPDTLCPIGYVTVIVGPTGSAWTFGVSNFSGPPTGVVFAFQDVENGMPDRPQVA